MNLNAKTEIVRYMYEEFKRSGKVQFRTVEIVDGMNAKFPSLNTAANKVSAFLSRLRADGIVTVTGKISNPSGGKEGNLWALVEILDKLTAPAAPARPISPEFAERMLKNMEPEKAQAFSETVGEVANLTTEHANSPSKVTYISSTPAPAVPPARKLNSVQRAGAFTATKKEMESMNDNRKPREGTPEHAIWQLTKLSERKGEQIEKLTTMLERAIGALTAAESRLNSQEGPDAIHRVSAETREAVEALREEVIPTQESVARVIQILSGELAEQKESLTAITTYLVQVLESVGSIQSAESDAYENGFVKGWTRHEKERVTLNAESLNAVREAIDAAAKRAANGIMETIKRPADNSAIPKGTAVEGSAWMNEFLKRANAHVSGDAENATS